jgi:hypothetical protein
VILTNRLNLLKRINFLVSLHCLVFKDHFTSRLYVSKTIWFIMLCLQALRLTFCLPASNADLYYDTKIRFVCQHIFLIIFYIMSSLSCPFCFRLACRLTGRLVYHVLRYYVNYYFKSFLNLFSFF